MEQTHSDGFIQLKQENENILTKLFIMEQELTKKDNIIKVLKKKLLKNKEGNESDSSKNSQKSIKEIYIIDPSKAVVEINDELLLYKKIYEKLIKSAKKNEFLIKKYNSIITNLQNENEKMKNKFQLQIKSVNRERETMLSYISQNTRKNTDKLSYFRPGLLKTNLNLSSLKDDSKLRGPFKTSILSSTANEEFAEILINCGITLKEFEKMSKTRHFSRLTETIEILFKTVIEKTLTINLLELENENLTTKNFELNKDNMNITSELTKIKLELSNSNKNTNYISNDETLSNNTSQITQNRNMNLASVVTYQRQLQQKHNEGNIIGNDPDLIASFDDASPESKRKKETENESSYTEQISGNDDDTCSEIENSSRKNNSIIFNGGIKKRQPNSTIESITSSEFRKEVDKKEKINDESYNGNNTQSQGKEMQSFVSGGGDDIKIIKNNLKI